MTGPKDPSELALALVSSHFGGERPDVSVECSGAESAINLCLAATKSGGKAVLVGMGPPEVKVRTGTRGEKHVCTVVSFSVW